MADLLTPWGVVAAHQTAAVALGVAVILHTTRNRKR